MCKAIRPTVDDDELELMIICQEEGTSLKRALCELALHRINTEKLVTENAQLKAELREAKEDGERVLAALQYVIDAAKDKP